MSLNETIYTGFSFQISRRRGGGELFSTVSTPLTPHPPPPERKPCYKIQNNVCNSTLLLIQQTQCLLVIFGFMNYYLVQPYMKLQVDTFNLERNTTKD